MRYLSMVIILFNMDLPILLKKFFFALCVLHDLI